MELLDFGKIFRGAERPIIRLHTCTCSGCLHIVMHCTTKTTMSQRLYILLKVPTNHNNSDNEMTMK